MLSTFYLVYLWHHLLTAIFLLPQFKPFQLYGDIRKVDENAFGVMYCLETNSSECISEMQ